MWVKCTLDNGKLAIDSCHIQAEALDFYKIKSLRASILLIGPLLYTFGSITIPFPGWCQIWKRPIDDHLKWFEDIWFVITLDGDNIVLEWKPREWNVYLNAWFWVTTTENLILASVLRKWKTYIYMSAIEPHVMNLVEFLRCAWANISIAYNHTIIIEWVEDLKWNFHFSIISDYIESGTYMVAWALLAKDSITIENARTEDLYTFMEKLAEAWVKIERDKKTDSVRVYKASIIKPVSIQTNIFPGFPTDLQSLFSVLMTQADGMSKIHEVLFEGRLNFLVELEKLGASFALLNPHEAVIFWKTSLKWWTTLTSWDLRAWVAVVLAALLAKGDTYVTNVVYIYRWYEDLVGKLQRLGASIEEV